ncbi:40S ribosomal protein S17-4, partial [Theobroma cacao]
GQIEITGQQKIIEKSKNPNEINGVQCPELYNPSCWRWVCFLSCGSRSLSLLVDLRRPCFLTFPCCLYQGTAKMGRVRTKTVKKSSRQVIENYYSRMTLDFHTNKKIVAEVALIPTKRLRNKIAGFSTHLIKRIQKGPVRGISLKLQEEERERRMDFVPDESAINTDEIKVDKETLDMLSALGMADIPGLVEVEPQAMIAPPVFGGPGGAGRRY